MDRTYESHHKKFYHQGMVIREQPETRHGKPYAQTKIERVQFRNHANSRTTFRNRWPAPMVKKLGEVGILRV